MASWLSGNEFGAIETAMRAGECKESGEQEDQAIDFCFELMQEALLQEAAEERREQEAAAGSMPEQDRDKHDVPSDFVQVWENLDRSTGEFCLAFMLEMLSGEHDVGTAVSRLVELWSAANGEGGEMCVDERECVVLIRGQYITVEQRGEAGDGDDEGEREYGVGDDDDMGGSEAEVDNRGMPEEASDLEVVASETSDDAAILDNRSVEEIEADVAEMSASQQLLVDMEATLADEAEDSSECEDDEQARRERRSGQRKAAGKEQQPQLSNALREGKEGRPSESGQGGCRSPTAATSGSPSLPPIWQPAPNTANSTDAVFGQVPHPCCVRIYGRIAQRLKRRKKLNVSAEWGKELAKEQAVMTDRDTARDKKHVLSVALTLLSLHACVCRSFFPLQAHAETRHSLFPDLESSPWAHNPILPWSAVKKFSPRAQWEQACNQERVKAMREARGFDVLKPEDAERESKVGRAQEEEQMGQGRK